MISVVILLLLPLAPALLLAFISNSALRGTIVRIGALAIACASVYVGYTYFLNGRQFFEFESHQVDLAVFGGEMLVGLVLLFLCKNIKPSQWWIPLLIIIQSGLIAWLELSGHLPKVVNPLYIDNFSIIMVLIIGIIGTLICVYAISYMRDYHHHDTDIKDRQRTFFFILFLFLSAMFGIVLCNNLVWLYFCWEITTLSSFVLIGYSKTKEAVANAYRALGLNLVGGLGFALALVYLVKFCPTPTLELDQVIAMALSPVPGLRYAALVAAVLICFAGLTKSAQMPFSSWLLGAMVAPTPVSALLHSSTMVKAGVFVIVKFAPVLAGTLPGYLLACVGGITFLMTSLMAVTQSNAKRVLAYSTIANLGLIVMCAGVGSPSAVWAAIMLIIFHAVAKALLFLGTGTIEHQLGSRDIEDMGGLIVTRPALGMVMIIGMLGMFLAPFGMLISKWVCIEALAFVGNFPPVLVILLAYGSAPTLFFWAKWMGKVISVPSSVIKLTGKIGGDEWVALWLLAIMTILASALFPIGANLFVDPYVQFIFGTTASLGASNILIMLLMLGLLVALPIGFAVMPRKEKMISTYLAGANLEDKATFRGGLGLTQGIVNRNYYLGQILSEKKMTVATVVITILTIGAMIGALKI